MRIHGLTVIKNECDIVVECLEAALAWCDYIYVLDNGSTDGSWEAVLRLSRRHEGIIPYKQDDCVFQPSLRSVIFNNYRDRAEEGDWWCRLDVDEFYIDDPGQFLASVPVKYQVVWNASFAYYFTDKDYDRYKRCPSLYDDDRPAHEKCRYYLNNWSERRFLRHGDHIVWDASRSWPANLGLAYPHRIRLKHYQWRSPQQMQKRLDVRMDAIKRGCASFRHERAVNWKTRVFDRAAQRVYMDAGRKLSWQDRIVESCKLDYDAHDGKYVLREELMPRIKGAGSSTINNAIKRVRKVLSRRVAGEGGMSGLSP